MIEKRRASRWHPVVNFKSNIVCGSIGEKAEVLDISAVGMRVFFPRAVVVGSEIYGMLDIPYNNIPFYVYGEVLRVKETEGVWELAVSFEKVRMYAFSEVFRKCISAQRVLH